MELTKNVQYWVFNEKSIYILCCVFALFFFLGLVYPMFPDSLDCPFMIAPAVFSNVYLSVSVDCLFLNAPSVFSNVYLCMIQVIHFPRSVKNMKSSHSFGI